MKSSEAMILVIDFISAVQQGSWDDAVATALAFHQCGPRSIPGFYAICGLSLLVLYFAPRGFSPVLKKPTFAGLCGSRCVPFTPLSPSMLCFTGIQSYSYTDQRKVETDVDRMRRGLNLARTGTAQQVFE